MGSVVGVRFIDEKMWKYGNESGKGDGPYHQDEVQTDYLRVTRENCSNRFNRVEVI